MPLIKRYPNRKLYNTETKKYIKLEEIADLIRMGEDVKVIDHGSGEDLTTLTFSQIILEEEKRRAGFLPKNVLAELVKAGGERVGNFQRTLSSSFDKLSQFDDEIKHRLDELAKRGFLTQDEASGLLKKIVMVGEVLKDSTHIGGRKNVEAALRRKGVPTKAEIERLNEQIDFLSAKIEELEQSAKVDPTVIETPLEKISRKRKVSSKPKIKPEVLNSDTGSQISE
jgi:polyhydroxyalkanoate synthesis repressor PhaR